MRSNKPWTRGRDLVENWREDKYCSLSSVTSTVCSYVGWLVYSSSAGSIPAPVYLSPTPVLSLVNLSLSVFLLLALYMLYALTPNSRLTSLSLLSLFAISPFPIFYFFDHPCAVIGQSPGLSQSCRR